jgi:hypothetical protein
MIIWLVFLLLIIALGFLFDLSSNENVKSIAFSLCFLCFFLFSAFRLGLGVDYSNYIDVIVLNDLNLGFIEPGYFFLVQLSNYYESIFLFFCFFSLFTSLLFLNDFRRSDMFVLSCVVFVCLPMLYFNTFNIVRQFLVSAIFLYSFNYISDRKYFKFCFLMIFSSFFHFSAIFLIPFYLIIKLEFSKFFYFFTIIFSICVGSILKPDVFSVLPEYFKFYSYYLSGNNDSEYNIGVFVILLNIFFIYSVFISNKLIKNSFDLIHFNSVFVCVVLYNFIPTLYFIYRPAFIFLVALPYFVSMHYFGRYKHLKLFAVILFLMLFFINFIFSNEDNSLIVPAGFFHISNI